MQVFGYVALSLLAVSLIAMALPGMRPGPLQRLLTSSALQSIGKYSYAIYIFQYPIILILESTIRRPLVEWSGRSPVIVALTIFVIATVLSIAAARVTWVLLEAPALSLKKYFPRRAAA